MGGVVLNWLPNIASNPVTLYLGRQRCRPRYSSFMRVWFLGLFAAFSMAFGASAPAGFETIAKQAEAARAQDRVHEAILLYGKGTRLRPSWSDGWWYLGSLLYDQDRFSEADTAFQHLLASPSHRGSALAFRGLCQYENGKYDEALAQFRAWAAAGWAGPPALRNVAVFRFALLLTREGKFVEALYLLSEEAQLAGDRPEVVEAMGLASLRMRYLPENYPPDLRERIWLAGKAAFYAAQFPKDYERADEFAARLEARYPAQAEVHYFRGTLYGFEWKKEEAEREYRKELKISPNHVASLVALAAIEFDRSEFAEAEKLARQAADADPKNAEAHYLLGRVLFTNGEVKASVSELETAKRLAPDNLSVRNQLVRIYMKLGRTKDAKAEMAAFVALKKKEDVMAPPKEKLAGVQETTH